MCVLIQPGDWQVAAQMAAQTRKHTTTKGGCAAPCSDFWQHKVCRPGTMLRADQISHMHPIFQLNTCVRKLCCSRCMISVCRRINLASV
jgi:hypothetical protein